MPAIDGLKLIEPRSYSEYGYPYSEWAELRDDPRLRWFEPDGWPGFWAIGKHADIVEVSKQPERFLNAPGMVMVRARENTQEGEQQIKTIINMDPPEHRKFRAVASPFFTPRALAQLDTLVEETATKLVDGLGSEGECDFIADVASIHPLKVIARILGVPADVSRYRRHDSRYPFHMMLDAPKTSACENGSFDVWFCDKVQ